MKRSTAGFIAYDLRPSKQAERRILLDFLKCANEAGVSISDCRYVGMGGTRFYDFHLVHRFLGVNNMVSLERDHSIYPRAEFNCPYDFIDVDNRSTTEFLAADSDETRTIYWFDYDDCISAEITDDIRALGTRIKPGGSAFVTVNSEPSGIFASLSDSERLNEFQNSFGDFSNELTIENMGNYEFSSTVYQVLMMAFKNAFAARTDGEFHPIFQVEYADTASMLTVGGVFCARKELVDISRGIKRDLPFLGAKKPYKIKNLNVTERERVLFDRAVTIRSPKSKEKDSLELLGFKEKDFNSYRDLIRFLPRYYESMI